MGIYIQWMISNGVHFAACVSSELGHIHKGWIIKLNQLNLGSDNQCLGFEKQKYIF